MYKLVSKIDGSRWATKGNVMIFCQVVWMSKKEDAQMYHLIDENGDEIKIGKEECLEEC